LWLALYVVLDGSVAIGPVQASLLKGIRDTGSIAAAQRRLGSSYSHVWKLVAAMNANFASPLVEPIHGGRHGGGARLTREGHTVLEAFRRLETRAWQQGRADLFVIAKAVRHAGCGET
jgi:molybdate transport system regulatory protein